jgi:hypothetical protein
VTASRSLFLGPLLIQDGLHNVAGLVHMRQIDFGLNTLGRPGGSSTGAGRRLAKMRAHLIRLVVLN